jgi:L-malate glycosyltransferase
MDNIMKVLMVTSAYPSNNTQSHGIIIASLANALSQKGIKICVVAPKTSILTPDTFNTNVQVFRYNYFFPPNKQILSEGPGLYFQFTHHFLAKIQVPFFILFEFLFLLSMIKQEKPDILHTHWIIPHGLIGAICHWLLGVPHIISVHGTDIHMISRNIFLKKILKMIISNSNTVSANSTYTSEKIELLNKSNNGKIVVIPMGAGIQISRTNTLQQQSIVVKKTKQILFVGRLIKLKGVDVLINAFVKILEKIPLCQLIIIGDGPEFQSLKKYACELSVSNTVIFKGRLSESEVCNYYKEADLVVLPSRMINGQAEGLGVVLLEAMALGIPVIGTNTGGISDIIHDKINGLLVPPDDPDALSKAVIKLFTEPILYDKFRLAGIHTIQTKFTWAAIADAFLEQYNIIQTDKR